MVGKIRAKVSKKQWKSSEGIMRRNQLERGRVVSMNEAFDQLRQVVPYGEYKGKKKSKVQTLQSAMQHIQNLLDLLNSPVELSKSFGENLNLSNYNPPMRYGSYEQYSNYSGSSDGEEHSYGIPQPITNCLLSASTQVVKQTSPNHSYNGHCNGLNWQGYNHYSPY